MIPPTRTRQRLATILLTITLILSSASCSYPPPDEDEEEEPYLTEAQMVDKGLTYLEERYGIDFDVKSIRAGGMFGEIPTGLNVTTPLYPDMTSLGVYWERVDGLDMFYDNFIYTIMEPEYLARAQQLTSTFFPTNFTYVSIIGTSHPPDEFDMDTTFEQFHEWARDNIRLTTVVGIPNTEISDYEIGADILKSLQQQTVSTGALRILVFTPENYELYVQTYPTMTEPGVVWPPPLEARIDHEWEA